MEHRLLAVHHQQSLGIVLQLTVLPLGLLHAKNVGQQSRVLPDSRALALTRT
jgi:hypothetical protein